MDKFCKIITGIVLIIKKDNKILCLKRNMPEKIGYGTFGLPGGTVEHNESIKQAACREAAEELGIKIEEEDLEIVHFLRLKEKVNPETKHATQILMLYFAEVKKWHGNPRNREPHKHSELAWFDIACLPDNLFYLNREALTSIKSGKSYAEYGW